MYCKQISNIIDRYLINDNLQLLKQFKSKYHSTTVPIWNESTKRHDYYDVTMFSKGNTEFEYLQWRTVDKIYEKNCIFKLGFYLDDYPVAHLKYSL